MRSFASVSVVIVLLTWSMVPADTHYVSKTGNDTPPYASWMSASQTIQAAIDASVNGDTVLVNNGTYGGDGNRDISFDGKALVLISRFGPDSTIIDCNASQLDPHRGFSFVTGEDGGSILNGFTIRNGYAPFDDPNGLSLGGAILCDSASPLIENCVIRSNVAYDQGGGIACINQSASTIRDCIIDSNVAINKRPIGNGGLGGGLRFINSHPIIIRCTISNNRANIGGGLSCNSSPAMIDSSIFSHNQTLILWGFEPLSPGVGGGIHFYKSHGSISNCVFWGNFAQANPYLDADAGLGGGVALILSDATISSCTFHENAAESFIHPDSLGIDIDGHGSGILCASSSPSISYSIIANSLDGDAVNCYDASSFPTIVCSNIYNNAKGDWVDCIAGQDSVLNNFSLDPQFCGPTTGDFRLEDSSPCLPQNSMCGILVGARGMGCVATDIDIDSETIIPMNFTLLQNYPNPFNASTQITYTLSRSSNVVVNIYDALGRQVTTLVSTSQAAGEYSTTWNGTDGQGHTASSGVYFYRLTVGEKVTTRKMLLLK